MYNNTSTKYTVYTHIALLSTKPIIIPQYMHLSKREIRLSITIDGRGEDAE